MVNVAGLVSADAGAVATQILSASPDPRWLDELIHHLWAARPINGLAEVLEVWDLSQAEFAALMGVSRQAVGKWMNELPAERAVMIADLAAATEVLVHYVRRDRVSAVVRRKAPALGGLSLIDLVAHGESGTVLRAVARCSIPQTSPHSAAAIQA